MNTKIMKQTFQKSLLCLLATAIVGIFTSCSDDDDAPKIPENIITDLVTIATIQEQGATFEFQKLEDSPTISLVAPNIKFDSYLYKKGQRVLISYVPQGGERYVNDIITVYGIQPVYNASIIEAPIADYPDWDFAPISVFELWRTGTFLNLYSLMEYNIDPRFKVIVDEETLSQEYPHIYLTYEITSTSNSSLKSFNASIDLAPIWDLVTCRGIIVHLNNSKGDDTITLDKFQTIKPL